MSAKRGRTPKASVVSSASLCAESMPSTSVRGIGLREPEPLRLGEHVVEAAALARHRGEDVVAGAVDDAVDGRRCGRRRAPPSACAGSGCRRRRWPRSRVARRARSRRRDDLLAVHGEQRLVGGDDVLAARDRLAARSGAPARSRRSARSRRRSSGSSIRPARVARQPDAGRRRRRGRVVEVDVGDASTSAIGAPGAPRDLARGARAAASPRRCRSCRSRSARRERAAPPGTRVSRPVPGARPASSVAPSAFWMPRIACRVRCSFSISAKRT